MGELAELPDPGVGLQRLGLRVLPGSRNTPSREDCPQMGELAELPDLGELDMQLPDAPDLEGTDELVGMDSVLDRNWDSYVSELGARGIAEQLGAQRAHSCRLPSRTDQR